MFVGVVVFFRFPGKMLYLGCIFRCLDPILNITAVLSYRDPFCTPLGKEDEARQCRNNFGTGTKSDHLLLHEAMRVRFHPLKCRFGEENFDTWNIHSIPSGLYRESGRESRDYREWLLLGELYVRVHLSGNTHSTPISSPIQHPFHTHFTPIQYPFNTHSTPIPHPFHTHSTPISHPFNTHSTPISPSISPSISTPIQYPFNTHSTLIHHPFNIHSSPIQRRDFNYSICHFRRLRSVRRRGLILQWLLCCFILPANFENEEAVCPHSLFLWIRQKCQRSLGWSNQRQ